MILMYGLFSLKFYSSSNNALLCELLVKKAFHREFPVFSEKTSSDWKGLQVF